MSRTFPGHVLELSRKIRGHVQDISGKIPGHVQEVPGNPANGLKKQENKENGLENKLSYVRFS